MELTTLLSNLEGVLRQGGLWDAHPPQAQALASQAPFCYDTLRFEQWLQWVFLPQLQQLLASGGPLPPACAIAPMAEVAYADRDEAAITDLIDCLQAIDRYITDHPGKTQ